MNSEDKSKLLGLFFWLFTALNILVLIIMALAFSVIGAVIANAPHKANDPPPEFFMVIFTVIFAFVLITTVLFSVPKVIAGYGLRAHKPWARTWAIVASVMCCFAGILGIGIGVFGLVFLFSDEGKRYFEANSYGQLRAGASPPPPNSWQ